MFAVLPLSAEKLPVNYRWYTITTPHFNIHYHDSCTDAAIRLSVIAEKVYAALTVRERWTPFFRTEVVLVDSTDIANGYSTPFPYNKIQIYATRPEMDGVLQNFDDWLELVFTHEFTHTLNTDAIYEIPSATRYTLGRLFFPNSILPIWILEGNAVYSESRSGTYGRLNSAYTDMILRMDFLSKNQKSLAEASTYPRRWPRGSVPYLYGGSFVQYLEKNYGEGTFTRVFRENGENIIPFKHGSIANIIYGKSFPEMWNDWQSFLIRRYTAEQDAIIKQGVTDVTLITKSGYTTDLPCYSPDGKYLYYTRIDSKHEPSLMRYSFLQKDQSAAHYAAGRINSPTSMSFTSTGQLIMSDVETYKSTADFYDLFEYNQSGRRVQKTSGARMLYVDAAKNFARRVYVTQTHDSYSLSVDDESGSRFIIQKTPVQIAYCRLSPDGNKIVFFIQRRKRFVAHRAF